MGLLGVIDKKNVARTRWTCSPFTGSVALCQQRLSLCAFLHREITWDDDAVSGLAEMTPPWMAPGPEAGLSGGQLPLALGYCCWWFFNWEINLFFSILSEVQLAYNLVYM